MAKGLHRGGWCFASITESAIHCSRVTDLHRPCPAKTRSRESKAGDCGWTSVSLAHWCKTGPIWSWLTQLSKGRGTVGPDLPRDFQVRTRKTHWKGCPHSESKCDWFLHRQRVHEQQHGCHVWGGARPAGRHGPGQGVQTVRVDVLVKVHGYTKTKYHSYTAQMPYHIFLSYCHITSCHTVLYRALQFLTRFPEMPVIVWCDLMKCGRMTSGEMDEFATLWHHVLHKRSKSAVAIIVAPYLVSEKHAGYRGQLRTQMNSRQPQM